MRSRLRGQINKQGRRANQKRREGGAKLERKKGKRETETVRQADTHTNRQTHRLTHGQTVKQKNEQTKSEMQTFSASAL